MVVRSSCFQSLGQHSRLAEGLASHKALIQCCCGRPYGFIAVILEKEIETGRVLYENAPVTEPELLMRAMRWIDNDPQVTAAGVEVSGVLEQPILTLFSRPQLDPEDVQSYLLTGRSASDRYNVLSIGTYLHPKLYVGYGFNLLEETSEFNTVYLITPRYGIGVNAGEADSNVNLTFTHER